NICRTARAALCGSCVLSGAAPTTTALYSSLIITDATARGSLAKPELQPSRAHPSPLQLYRFVAAARSALHRYEFSCRPEAGAERFWSAFLVLATARYPARRLGCVRQ